MIKHLAFLTFLVSFSAFADLNGQYKGTVKYTDYNGSAQDVELDVSIEATNTLLKVKEAQGWILITDLEVQNGKLLYNSAEVGTITDTEVIVKDYTGNQGLTYSITLMLNGNDLAVKDASVSGGKMDGLEGSITKVAFTGTSYPVRGLHPRFLVD